MTTYSISVDDLVSLKDKTILITGAATGIGRSAVKIALENGANVAVGDWNEEAALLIAPFGDRALYKKCDVSNWDDVLGLFEEAHKKFGVIHSVISNAGINTHEGFLSDEFDKKSGKLLAPSVKSIDVNLVGQIYVTKCAIHFFRKWPDVSSQLVITSSAGAFFPAPPIYLYCAAKAGLLGLMRGLRTETIKENITINTVAPWLTITPMVLPDWLQKWGDLPKNSTTGVANALFLPILQPEINGKSFFVAGDQIIEFEDTLHNAEPQWMGE
ncbi:hypothetical protein G7Z17_g2417 [Cylindrodendrum hubeiense]|uniref:NAD(P)-binding protein n=1 Tax=Cylindrodendrum hubeiense TaxID=595255 RepID=A0A9P5HKT6_9HYPO|nr:hypothetical protein G7Z17_g2417 [Cylindrodendrum hubeiense]